MRMGNVPIHTRLLRPSLWPRRPLWLRGSYGFAPTLPFRRRRLAVGLPLTLNAEGQMSAQGQLPHWGCWAVQVSRPKWIHCSLTGPQSLRGSSSSRSCSAARGVGAFVNLSPVFRI